jgi:DNA processing protein
VDDVYPADNRDLYERLVETGCVVSESEPGRRATARDFPRRNRIISGLSRAVVVVEAELRSGSLITARLAAEAGREVFAIPGSIHSPQSKGCHALIKQGAKLVEAAQDILEELRWEAVTNPATLPAVPEVETDPVLVALGRDPCDLDTLAARTGLAADALLAQLLPLELDGRVAQLPGGRYQRLN